MKQYFYSIFASIFMLSLIACEPDIQPELTFVLVEQENIKPQHTSVDITCQLFSNLTIDYARVVLSTTEDFAEPITILLDKDDDDNSLFSITISDLAPATKYYVRYQVENIFSAFLSPTITSFETFELGLPIVYTDSVSEITYTSAKVSGFVRNVDGPILLKGFCYSKSPQPTINDEKVVHTGQLGLMNSYLLNLEEGYTYYVRAFAVNSNGISYGRELCFTTLYHTFHEGHEYVDLGLSVKWATSNLGEDLPSKFGDYYAWGETMPKKDYSWGTYQYGNSKSLNKYHSEDNKTQLDFSDDAARAQWGGEWRMPTAAEMAELYKKCEWTREGLGYRITSKINGNSIFLAAGGCMTGLLLFKPGEQAYYWSCSRVQNEATAAYPLYFDRDGYMDKTIPRYYGCFVRPVYPR